MRDTATLLDCVSGPMPGDPYAAVPPARPFAEQLDARPERLRIGFMRDTPREIEIDPDCVAAVDRCARLLESLGHDVVEAHPKALEEGELVAHYVDAVAANVAHSLNSWGEKVGQPIEADEVEPLTWALAERGRSRSAPDHLRTLEYVHGFGRRLAEWWQSGFDLLLTPTHAQLAPPLGRLVSKADQPFAAYFLAAPYGVFTLPHNLSGQPAISLPLHVSESGLPIGSQLVAEIGNEALLLRVSAQLEEAAPWIDRVPPLFG